MCGLSGFIDYNLNSSEELLKNMTDALMHRGPDDAGYLFKNYSNYQIGLGHRRLSILDLSSLGHQPMVFQNLSIVYNGEVYNFNEIRLDLEKQGYVFESGSDTEVILKAFHLWGIKMVDRLNGMFAIAIFDSNTQSVTFIRDRAGVKPLYWYNRNGLFMFSSELKSFHKHPNFIKEINKDGLTLFLQYGYILEPYTIFQYTHKLQAGHYLVLDLKNNEIAITKYWEVIDFYNKPKLDISEQEATDETESILKTACDYRMVSDVPVGVFLSGGYDSSAVTAMLQSSRTERLKTFSIGFYEENFNEAHHAKKIADYLGTDHTEYYCTPSDALNILPELPFIWDEPFGDSSAIPTVLVSKLARKDVTVSLSADGGDEIFGGYDKYTSIAKKMNLFNRIPVGLRSTAKGIFKSNVSHYLAEQMGVFNAAYRFNKYSNMIGVDELGLLKSGSQVFDEGDLKKLLIDYNENIDSSFDIKVEINWLDNLLAIDYKTYQLDDILTKVDRATMSVGLEGREPLLDYRIAEFVAMLSPNLKIKNGDKKYLLKKIVHKYLPLDLLDRPKKGFSVPIFDWFKSQLKEIVLFYLDEKRLLKGGVFNVKEVLKMRNSYLVGNDININQIWFLLVFEMWRERWDV